MNVHFPIRVLVSLSFLAGVGFSGPVEAERIKDVSSVYGVRSNQLLGYGVVVGLEGTGDFGRSAFTVQSIASMLTRFGIKINGEQIRTRNVAAVMVTAEIGPFVRAGQRIDVTVSSIGNAQSLRGGTLLLTPLKGVDGLIYSMAQGALSVGGYSANGIAGNRQKKNHVNVGRIPNGGLLERSLATGVDVAESIDLVLDSADFTTAVAMADRINSELNAEILDSFNRSQEEERAKAAEVAAAAQAAAPDGEEPPAAEAQPAAAPAPEEQLFAAAIDSRTVRISVPGDYQEKIPRFIAKVEALEVTTDRVARVVINERTGTVVIGSSVSISEVAVAQGSLRIEVSTEYQVSQPNPLGQGSTETVGQSNVDVEEEKSALKQISASSSVGDVVTALNSVGASPQDLIAILQAMKSAGALHAEILIQ
jgi:flagellar P-ring protein FlgI